jgi:hypothetical protein
MYIKNNFKYLYANFSILISKSFFYSQSLFKDLIKDYFFNFIFNKNLKPNSSPLIKGDIISDELLFNPEKSVKANIRSKFTLSYKEEKIPTFLNEIIYKHRNEIEKYLGTNFIFEKVLYFRNFNLSEEFYNYDIYSNVWHQDSHDGCMLLKIFVLLSDVDESDGPFIYLDRSETKKYWPELRDRWTFDKFLKLPTYFEEKKLIGKKGDYLIINTANSMHRASIPKFHRDMLQITLYPRWRANNERKMYCFEKK